MNRIERLDAINKLIQDRLMEELGAAVHEGDYELVDAINILHDVFTSEFDRQREQLK